MATSTTGVRIVFFGSHKQPSYVIETCSVPEKDKLKDGEILIKVLLSTLCSFDIECIDGKQEVNAPCVLGHEGVGEVVASKRCENGTESFKPGDRVVFSTSDFCESCQLCKSDMQECCSSNTRYGTVNLKDGSGLNGCYATHMILRRSTIVIHVPSNVSNAVASPANCALSTMVHAIGVATVTKAKQSVAIIQMVHALGVAIVTKAKQSVAIIQGANLMGLYACALLHEAGFLKVFCHDTSCERLRLVPRFGGIPVLVEKNYELSNSLSQSGIADIVIDVCGNWDVIPYALQALCHRGIYLFVGSTHLECASISVQTILKKCITIRGIQGYKVSHLKKAMEFLSETVSKYPYESLVSSPFSLQDFHSAVNLARAKRYHRIAVRPNVV